MKTIMLATAFALVSISANAQDATKPASPTWAQVQAACGGEYRAAKGQADRPAWPEYLASCRDRKGFVPKRTRLNVTLPDVK